MTTSTKPHDVAETSPRMLTPVLGPRCALKAVHVAATALFCALLVLLNYLPLRNTDLWGHVAYGNWILEHLALAAEDPWMPLAEGMRAIDTLWLSQVVLATVDTIAGAAGLSNLFAVIVTLTYLVFARVFYLQSQRTGVSLLATLVMLAVGWSRLTTIRPEIFALLAFALLLWLLAHDRARGGTRLVWIGVPVLFALWANLHGSFACGLLVLACFIGGRAVDVWWQSRSLWTVLTDRPARRWLYLLELAAAATLLNPYGMDLWIEVSRFSLNGNLRDISEWSPLVILGVGGREFALAAVLLLIVMRHSRRHVTAAEVAMLAVFGTLAVAQTRMMGWFAPVFALVLTPHLAEIINRLRPVAEEEPLFETAAAVAGELPPGRSWRYTMFCVGMVWVAFAFSGMSRPLLGGPARTDDKLYSDTTPLAAARYLREHPPVGQIYNPQWWGDWLVWQGPAKLEPFAMTHVHLLPRQVWQDYRRISFGEIGWDVLLDRYHVNTLVIDKKNQAALAGMVGRSSNWLTQYADDQALIAVRAKKAPSAANPPAAAKLATETSAAAK
jgi:hypothetical protein